METCYKSENLTIEFDQETKTLFTRWKTDEYMPNEAYRKEIENLADNIIKYQPTNILSHLKEAKYTVPVEIQAWVTAKLNPLYKVYKTQKIALIMSNDFMTQLSVEQLVEDTDSESVQILFFGDEQKGTEWLLSNENLKEKAA